MVQVTLGRQRSFSSRSELVNRTEKHLRQVTNLFQGGHISTVTHTFTPRGNLASPIHLTGMSLDMSLDTRTPHRNPHRLREIHFLADHLFNKAGFLN